MYQVNDGFNYFLNGLNFMQYAKLINELNKNKLKILFKLTLAKIPFAMSDHQPMSLQVDLKRKLEQELLLSFHSHFVVMLEIPSLVLR